MQQGKTATKQRKQVQQSQAICNPLPNLNKLPNDIQIPSKVVWYLDPKNIPKTPFTSGGMTGCLGTQQNNICCPNGTSVCLAHSVSRHGQRTRYSAAAKNFGTPQWSGLHKTRDKSNRSLLIQRQAGFPKLLSQPHKHLSVRMIAKPPLNQSSN